MSFSLADHLGKHVSRLASFGRGATRRWRFGQVEPLRFVCPECGESVHVTKFPAGGRAWCDPCKVKGVEQ